MCLDQSPAGGYDCSGLLGRQLGDGPGRLGGKACRRLVMRPGYPSQALDGVHQVEAISARPGRLRPALESADTPWQWRSADDTTSCHGEHVERAIDVRLAQKTHLEDDSPKVLTFGCRSLDDLGRLLVADVGVEGGDNRG